MANNCTYIRIEAVGFVRENSFQYHTIFGFCRMPRLAQIVRSHKSMKFVSSCRPSVRSLVRLFVFLFLYLRFENTHILHERAVRAVCICALTTNAQCISQLNYFNDAIRISFHSFFVLSLSPSPRFAVGVAAYDDFSLFEIKSNAPYEPSPSMNDTDPFAFVVFLFSLCRFSCARSRPFHGETAKIGH